MATPKADAQGQDSVTWLPGRGDALLCVLYLCLNCALNATNRRALAVQGFAFPLTLTVAHMLCGLVLLAPVMLQSPRRTELLHVWAKEWPALCAIGVVNVAQIALNNSSLVHLELAMNQVVRATLPVFVAVMQAMQARPPPSSNMPSLITISFGVHLVVRGIGSSSSEWWGVLVVTAGVCLQAVQMCFANRLLSAKLDTLQVMFATAPSALIAVILPAATLEGARFLEFASAQPVLTVQVLLGTSLMAVIYNVVLYETISRLSASGSALLGNAKVIFVVAFAKLRLGEMAAWTAWQVGGAALTLAGSGLFAAMHGGQGQGERGRRAARAPWASRGSQRAVGCLCVLGLLGFLICQAETEDLAAMMHAALPSRRVPAAERKSGVDPCRGLAVDPALGRPRQAAEGELVLVTGGSGFIGSHLVESLLGLGYVVRVFDNLETGNLLFLDLTHPRLQFVYGDIMDVEALNRAMLGVSGVFHLGAASKVLPSLKDPAMGTYNVERNAVGTSRVLEAANSTKAVLKVVYAASSTYYGNQQVPFMEDDPFVPTSPYAASKYMGELIVATNDQLYGLRSLSLRFFMVYGPRNPAQGAYAVVTGKFLARFAEGLPLVIEGSGQNFRDFVHVKDVARALILGYQSDVHGQSINVGTGLVHSVEEVADMVSSNQEHVAARKNDLLGTMADTCLAKKLLHFEAWYDFSTVMREMIEDAKRGASDGTARMWSQPRVVAEMERHDPGWSSRPVAERAAALRDALHSGRGEALLSVLRSAAGAAAR